MRGSGVRIPQRARRGFGNVTRCGGKVATYSPVICWQVSQTLNLASVGSIPARGASRWASWCVLSEDNLFPDCRAGSTTPRLHSSGDRATASGAVGRRFDSCWGHWACRRANSANVLWGCSQRTAGRVSLPSEDRPILPPCSAGMGSGVLAPAFVGSIPAGGAQQEFRRQGCRTDSRKPRRHPARRTPRSGARARSVARTR
jgi:hypothetical protein